MCDAKPVFIEAGLGVDGEVRDRSRILTCCLFSQSRAATAVLMMCTSCKPARGRSEVFSRRALLPVGLMEKECLFLYLSEFYHFLSGLLKRIWVDFNRANPASLRLALWVQKVSRDRCVTPSSLSPNTSMLYRSLISPRTECEARAAPGVQLNLVML